MLKCFQIKKNCRLKNAKMHGSFSNVRTLIPTGLTRDSSVHFCALKAFCTVYTLLFSTTVLVFT